MQVNEEGPVWSCCNATDQHAGVLMWRRLLSRDYVEALELAACD